MNAAKPSRMRKLAYALLPTVVLLLVFEFGLRTYDIVTGTILSEDLVANWYKSSTQAHPFLDYTSKRNFHGALPFLEPGRLFEVRTNSHGFRTHEFYPKMPGRFRIAIMGDSWMWGYNTNQNETTAAVLERLLREQVSEAIEVFSLGGVSYSVVQYAVLARIYLDYLKPDIVIVAIDQTDFEEDLRRIDEYITDDEGAPFVLTRADTLVEQVTSHRRIVMDHDRKLRVEQDTDWLLRVRMGSSLFNHAFEGATRLRRWAARGLASRTKEEPDASEVRRPDPVEEHEEFLRALPGPVVRAVIPYSLAAARRRFVPTLRSLEFIARECERRGIAVYLSSYPYPWLVSVREAVAFQRAQFGGIYDLRWHRIPAQLVEAFAETLGVPHLNAYPVFERDSDGKYGDHDPHFNAAGYARYASFLFEAIRDHVEEVVCADSARSMTNGCRMRSAPESGKRS